MAKNEQCKEPITESSLHFTALLLHCFSMQTCASGICLSVALSAHIFAASCTRCVVTIKSYSHHC